MAQATTHTQVLALFDQACFSGGREVGMEQEVPAWRIAYKHPKIGHWRLGVYEYRDREMAEDMVTYMNTDRTGTVAVLIPCQTYRTGHGVDTACFSGGREVEDER